jgi:carbon monoxide dehydrogenase subunit G
VAQFSAHTHAEATVRATAQEIWDVLRDPSLMAQFTPFLKQITEDGEHWRWEMAGLDVAGLKIAPSFTEKMHFDEPRRIEFHHDPPAGVREKAGAEGWYELTPADEGTHLATDLEITVDLPVPRAAGPVVRKAMERVIQQMGDRFSANLLQHLGTTEV